MIIIDLNFNCGELYNNDEYLVQVNLIAMKLETSRLPEIKELEECSKSQTAKAITDCTKMIE